ncbi:MAG: PEP-CTERM sorting domain-containing protein [Rhodospirillales bacterium]
MKYRSLLAAAALLAAPAAANAAIFFDQNVTNAVIFGSGNTNGSYTVDRQSGIELGLRGKLRFNGAGMAENTFNSNGDGSYNFFAGHPTAPQGFGFAQPPTTTPFWNFEWSVNTNFDGSVAGRNLDDLYYRIKIDFDPGAGTNFVSFDPIIVSLADHSIGTNATASGAGMEAADAVAYAALIASNNLAQNSWNMEFFNQAPFLDGNNMTPVFDPLAYGTYTIMLQAFSDEARTTELASVSIDINAVPEPGTLAAFGLGLLGLATLRRREMSARPIHA